MIPLKFVKYFIYLLILLICLIPFYKFNNKIFSIKNKFCFHKDPIIFHFKKINLLKGA